MFAVNPLRDWIFHDASWPRVVSRFADRERVRRGEAVEADDSPQVAGDRVRMGAAGLEACDAPACPDNWLYLHLDPATHPWTDYRWSFEVRRLSEFHELQLAFRYVDFYNRYRYRFEDGCLHFDVVHQGRFHNSLSRVACPLEPGTWHAIEIDVVDDVFACRVDGRVRSVDFDPQRRFARGPVAVILWEDDGRTPLRAEFRHTSIRPLVHG